jgi:hypothetical protein
MLRRYFLAHQRSKRVRLAILLGPMLLTAVLFWGTGQQAAAQDAPVAANANPGETIPPPEGTPMYLPLLAANSTPIPTLPPHPFDKVPVAGGSLGWPAQSSPDVNLSLRSYTPTVAYLGIVNKDGPTDDQAPQMAPIFTPARLPAFTATYQVYDWDWSCNPPAGCRGNPLTYPHEVTLLEMATTPGEPLSIASRSPRIYPGDFKAMVLYAEEGRLTITYTRDDSPAAGYMMHFEDVAVAPDLLALYRQLDAAGRKELPALRNGEIWGTAAGSSVKVAVRDRGTFMDPRACKDWWVDYRSQCTVLMWRSLPALPPP